MENPPGWGKYITVMFNPPGVVPPPGPLLPRFRILINFYLSPVVPHRESECYQKPVTLRTASKSVALDAFKVFLQVMGRVSLDQLL
jgi:hypothetical protein